MVPWIRVFQFQGTQICLKNVMGVPVAQVLEFFSTPIGSHVVSLGFPRAVIQDPPPAVTVPLDPLPLVTVLIVLITQSLLIILEKALKIVTNPIVRAVLQILPTSTGPENTGVSPLAGHPQAQPCHVQMQSEGCLLNDSLRGSQALAQADQVQGRELGRQQGEDFVPLSIVCIQMQLMLFPHEKHSRR